VQREKRSRELQPLEDESRWYVPFLLDIRCTNCVDFTENYSAEKIEMKRSQVKPAIEYNTSKHVASLLILVKFFGSIITGNWKLT
jgi:hypothetical protein